MADVKEVMISLLPSSLVVASGNNKTVMHSTLNSSIEFQASIVADLIYSRRFTDKNAWNRSVGSFMLPWFSDKSEDSLNYAENVREHYHAIDRAKYAIDQKDDEDGEILCNTLFSLAYGTLLLLSHTTLRLIRGRRYGILGPNGSGKTTLMRQLKEGKVENFPPQSELRCVMVEHSLQGEDTSLSIVDFIAAGT